MRTTKKKVKKKTTTMKPLSAEDKAEAWTNELISHEGESREESLIGYEIRARILLSDHSLLQEILDTLREHGSAQVVSQEIFTDG